MAFLVVNDHCRIGREILWVSRRRDFYRRLDVDRMAVEKETMKIQILTTRTFALLALVVFCVGNSLAQESNYRRIEVGKRVSVEVPAHWHVRDLDERRNIAAAGEAITNAVGRKNEPNHVSSLSVVSQPEPVGAIIRISFIPTDGLTQSDVRQAIQSDRVGILREIGTVFREEMAVLSKGMEKQGMKIIGRESVGIDSIGDMTAFTFSYRRTSAIGPWSFLVTQFHVPVGREKVLITLSYRESDALLFRPILDRVKRSVVIREHP